MLGVHEQRVEIVLEDYPDRPPVDARALNRDLGDAVGGQPVVQRQQPLHGGAELGHLLSAPVRTGGKAHAGGHLRLVHVQSCGTRDHHVHGSPALRRATEQRRRPLETSGADQSDERAQVGTVPGSGGRLTRQTGDRLTGAMENAASPGGSDMFAHFHPPRVARPSRKLAAAWRSASLGDESRERHFMVDRRASCGRRRLLPGAGSVICHAPQS